MDEESIDGEVEFVTDDEDDTEAEAQVETGNPYPWAQDNDESRRCFVFDKLSSPENDGGIQVENMSKVDHWLKTGEVPVKGGKPRLGVVK